MSEAGGGGGGGGDKCPPSTTTYAPRLLLRGRERTYVQPFKPSPAPTLGRALPDTPATEDAEVRAGYDASSGVSPISADGRFVAVTLKERVEIYALGDGAAAPALQSRVEQPGVVCAHFSPLGTLLLTWHRKREDKEGALGGAFARARFAPILPTCTMTRERQPTLQ